MAMSREQFDALVRRLEEYARQKPVGYRLRVGLLAAVGYLYLFLVLVLLMGLIGLLVAAAASGHMGYLIGKLGWLLITLVVIILRALWVRLEAPDGIPLSRTEVPRLFALLDELTTALRAPRFHHVLLTADFNAGVVQVPRLGVFGWQQNYLLLGLPLLQAVSLEQFRAVLAHELGHLSGNHSRFSGWIYRVRRTWGQLLERLEKERHPGVWVFAGFLNWYAPFFSAYSFVLARADEYVADRCAAELAGPESAGEALIQIAIKGEYVRQQFWPQLYRTADRQAEPPAATFVALGGALRRAVTTAAAAGWLDQKLGEKTDNADTHPCLRDRLAAIAYLPVNGDPAALRDRLAALGYAAETANGEAAVTASSAASTPPSAAEALLGDAAEQLTAQLERSWREAIGPRWQERYRYAQEARSKLQVLEAKAQQEPLSEGEALNRARWTAEFRGPEAAIPLWQEFLADHPQHAQAHYALGQILLEQQDGAGLDHLERAMAADPDAMLPACQLAYAFLQRQGRSEEADRYRKRAEEQYERLARAQQERAGVSDRDRFEPHGLPAETVERLREQLARIDRVGAAYLARKVVSLFPEKPFYVLAVRPRVAWYQFRSEVKDAKLSNQLASQLQWPGEALVIVLGPQTRRLGKRLRQVPGAEIFRR